MNLNTIPMTTLALSDNWLVGIFVAQMVFNVGLFAISFAAKRGTDRIDGLEDDLKKRSDEAIEQRFNVLREKFLGKIDLLTRDVESAQRRLGAGDRLLKALTERDHQGEMKTLTAIEGLRRDVVEHMATKAELGELEKSHHKLEREVAGIRRTA